MKTQRFKNLELTRTKTVNNILRVYDSSPHAIKYDAKDWYTEARVFATDLYNKASGWHESLSFAKVCGIIAALSPQKSWSENKRIAESFLTTGKAYHTKMLKDKARDILDLSSSENEIEEISDILKGNKISNFFLNIFSGVADAVTIDTHATHIAVNDVTIRPYPMTTNQYNFFVQCYRIAGAKRGVKPSVMQAITWVAWREDKKSTKVEEGEDDLPF